MLDDPGLPPLPPTGTQVTADGFGVGWLLLGLGAVLALVARARRAAPPGPLGS